MTNVMAPDVSPAEVQRLIDERSQWARWSTRQRWLKLQVRRFLKWLGVPGFIQPTEMYDELITHSLLQVRVTPLFTIFSVHGKHYYFYRISGKFDGTGMCVSCPTSANPLGDCRLGQAQE